MFDFSLQKSFVVYLKDGKQSDAAVKKTIGNFHHFLQEAKKSKGNCEIEGACGVENEIWKKWAADFKWKMPAE